MEILVEFIKHGLSIWGTNAPWMGWNAFLALVPLVLSFLLFWGEKKRSAWWWIGVVAFVAFLPNAPYVLTDVIHLIDEIQSSQHNVWVTTLIFIPLYMTLFFVGLESFVLSLIWLGRYLRRCGQERFILAAELSLSLLSAVGIHLGRFHRFNSWDILVQPNALLATVVGDFVTERPLIVVGGTFCVLAFAHLLLKPINLALAVYWSMRRRKKDMTKGPTLETLRPAGPLG